MLASVTGLVPSTGHLLLCDTHVQDANTYKLPINSMQDLRTEAPTQKALETAKAQTLNSFVFNFASTNTQLQRILVYSLLGLPQDYLFQYKTGIEQVTSEDVRNAAQRHLHPDEQIVVVAADRTAFEADLTQKIGQVEILTIDS